METYFLKQKQLCVLFAMLVLTSICLTACGSVDSNSKYNKKMSDDELKKAIVECNKNSEIIQNGEYIKVEQKIGAEGERECEVTTGPDGYFAMFSNWGDYNVTSDRVSYGYYSFLSDVKIVRVYDDELWQYNVESRILGDFDEVYRADEEYLERELKDGKVCIKARYQVNETDKEALMAYGVDVGREIEYIESYRELDADTLRICSLTEAVKYADESEPVVYTNASREYSKENPCKEKEDKLYNEIFGDKTHTIKITARVGTEDEKEYEIAAADDVSLDYWIKDSQGEYDVFEDSDCTVPVRLDENDLIKFESDKTLFMK